MVVGGAREVRGAGGGRGRHRYYILSLEDGNRKDDNEARGTRKDREISSRGKCLHWKVMKEKESQRHTGEGQGTGGWERDIYTARGESEQ